MISRRAVLLGGVGGFFALSAGRASAEEFNVNRLAEAVVRDGLTDENREIFAQNRDYFKENADFAQSRFSYHIEDDLSDFDRKLAETARVIKRGQTPDERLSAIRNESMKDLVRYAGQEMQEIMGDDSLTDEAKESQIDAIVEEKKEAGILYYQNLAGAVANVLKSVPAPKSAPAPKGPQPKVQKA